MREGQCYSCYIDTMFQLFGQREEYNEKEYTNDYLKALENGDKVVECVSCGQIVEYKYNANTKRWAANFLSEGE